MQTDLLSPRTQPFSTSANQPSGRVADLQFSTFVTVLEEIVQCGKLYKRKVAQLRRFFTTSVPRHNGDDLHQLFRLLLPKLDVTRGYFGIKEKRLAGLLAAALGACRERADAAKDWMRLAHHTHAKFPVVMQKVLLDHYCPASIPRDSDTLTLGMVNACLDQLAALAARAVRDAANPDDQRSRLRALTGRRATEQQVQLLRELLRRCTPAAARWLISIVLREDLPIGVGEKTVLDAFHPDAHDAFASCSDLRLVLDGLCRPGSSWKRQEVEPGLNAAPQLAARVEGGPAEAAAYMKGRPFLVETKFDGWRIQLHVTGGGPDSAIHYFSRNVKDHGKRSNFCVLDTAVASFLQLDAVAPVDRELPPARSEAAAERGHSGNTGSRRGALPRIVLDGEMLVWNKTRRSFESFGMLESTIRAAADAVEPDTPVQNREVSPVRGEDGRPLSPTAGELEVVYVAFDILYLRDTSVVHLPLRERKRLLGSVLRLPGAEAGGRGSVPVGPRGAVTFRAEPLRPEEPMLDGKVHCWTCSTPQEAQQVYERAAAACEEGVVLKALDEPYHLCSRATTWIKIKPDYLTQGEFDAVILGQLYDHTTSQVSVGGVYLLGLLEAPPRPGQSATWVTFATVGTGVSREERRTLLEPRLAGNLVASPRGLDGAGRAARLRAVPSWCRATGARDEWPDWWVVDPDKSVVVQVNADVRLTRTGVFAAGYTTRFPRITRIRDDKTPRDATTLADLQAMVRRAGGGEPGAPERQPTTGVAGGTAVVRTRRRRNIGPRHPRPAVPKVPLHLLTCDVSEVPVHFDLLRGAFVVLEGLYGPAGAARRQELSRLVRLIGGRCSANYIPSGDFRTSYVIVVEWLDSCHGRDKARDLLRPVWLEDCYLQQRLIWPPKPSQAWRFSSVTLAGHTDKVDAYGDPYFELLDEDDLAAVLDWHVNCVRPAPAKRLTAGTLTDRDRTAAPALAPEQLPELDSCEPKAPSMRTTGAAAALMQRLEEEMLAHGEEPPAGPHRLFSGSVILLLDVSPTPPATMVRSLGRAAYRDAPQRSVDSRCVAPTEAAPQEAASASRVDPDVTAGEVWRSACPLLHGVRLASDRATLWAAEEGRQQLEDLRLAVLRGGGDLADRWSSAVTHVVLYDGVLDDVCVPGDDRAGGMNDPDCPGFGAAAETGTVEAALKAKCTRQEWDAACTELLCRAAAAASSDPCSPPDTACYCCGSCCSSDASSDDDEELAVNDGQGEWPDPGFEGGGLAGRQQHHPPTHGPGTSAAEPEGSTYVQGAAQAPAAAAAPSRRPAPRRRWWWKNNLAQLLCWLGAACGAAHRRRRYGPAGGALVTDWRWIRDSVRDSHQQQQLQSAGRGSIPSTPMSVGPDGAAAPNTSSNGDPLGWTSSTASEAGCKAAASDAGDRMDDEDADEDVDTGDDPQCAVSHVAALCMRLPETLYPPRVAPPAQQVRTSSICAAKERQPAAAKAVQPLAQPMRVQARLGAQQPAHVPGAVAPEPRSSGSRQPARLPRGAHDQQLATAEAVQPTAVWACDAAPPTCPAISISRSACRGDDAAAASASGRRPWAAELVAGCDPDLQTARSGLVVTAPCFRAAGPDHSADVSCRDACWSLGGNAGLIRRVLDGSDGSTEGFDDDGACAGRAGEVAAGRRSWGDTAQQAGSYVEVEAPPHASKSWQRPPQCCRPTASGSHPQMASARAAGTARAASSETSTPATCANVVPPSLRPCLATTSVTSSRAPGASAVATAIPWSSAASSPVAGPACPAAGCPSTSSGATARAPPEGRPSPPGSSARALPSDGTASAAVGGRNLSGSDTGGAVLWTPKLPEREPGTLVPGAEAGDRGRSRMRSKVEKAVVQSLDGVGCQLGIPKRDLALDSVCIDADADEGGCSAQTGGGPVGGGGAFATKPPPRKRRRKSWLVVFDTLSTNSDDDTVDGAM